MAGEEIEQLLSDSLLMYFRSGLTLDLGKVDQDLAKQLGEIPIHAAACCICLPLKHTFHIIKPLYFIRMTRLFTVHWS